MRILALTKEVLDVGWKKISETVYKTGVQSDLYTRVCTQANTLSYIHSYGSLSTTVLYNLYH